MLRLLYFYVLWVGVIGQCLVGNHRREGLYNYCAECTEFTDYPDLSKLGTLKSKSELRFVFPVPRGSSGVLQRFLLRKEQPCSPGLGLALGLPLVVPWLLPAAAVAQGADFKGLLLLWSSAAVLFAGPLTYSLLDLTLKVFVQSFFLFHEVWQRKDTFFRKTLKIMFSSFPFDASLHLFFSCSSFFSFYASYRNQFFFSFPANISSCVAFLAIAFQALTWYQFPPALHTCEHPLASPWAAWSPALRSCLGMEIIAEC